MREGMRQIDMVHRLVAAYPNQLEFARTADDIERIQRTGKTFFSRLLRKLLGESNCQVLTQDVLEAGFTGWATRTKLVIIEEVRSLTTSRSATTKTVAAFGNSGRCSVASAITLAPTTTS